MVKAQQEIQARLDSGLDYNTAASTVYTDLGCAVNDLDSWTDYQAIDGGCEDEHAVVSLQYVEEGLLTVDVAEGQGAFGDDLAIEVLATEYQREIFVVSRSLEDSCKVLRAQLQMLSSCSLDPCNSWFQSLCA